MNVLLAVLMMIVGAVALVLLNSIPSFFSTLHTQILAILIFVFMAVMVVVASKQ